LKSIAFYNKTFLVLKEDEALLKENISRILMTVPGERVNNPLFGSNLRSYLFMLETIMKEEVESDIRFAINRWEPRVSVTSINTELQEDQSTFLINIEGTNVDTGLPFTYEQLIRL
jgi:phage baseplate assembly protein W